MRFKITVRGTDLELRGYADGAATLQILSQQMEGVGLVIASEADDDFNPFAISQPEYPPTPEKSREVIQMQMDDFGVEHEGLLERLTQLHYGQALVIRGERHLRQMVEAESLRRELHHFEAEQMSENYLNGLRQAEALNRQLVAEKEDLLRKYRKRREFIDTLRSERPTWDQIGDILQTPPDGLSGEEYRRQVIELMQKERGE